MNRIHLGRLTFVMLIMMVPIPIAVTMAAPEAGNDEAPRACMLSKEHMLVLPSSLSLSQVGYLSELCDKVLRWQSRLLLTRMGPGISKTTRELYELDRQYVANMSQLLDQAIGTEPFPEEAFWQAWLAERRLYRHAVSPLVQEEAERIREREPDKDDVLRDPRDR